jgi:hypothetical protein
MSRPIARILVLLIAALALPRTGSAARVDGNISLVVQAGGNLSSYSWAQYYDTLGFTHEYYMEGTHSISNGVDILQWATNTGRYEGTRQGPWTCGTQYEARNFAEVHPFGPDVSDHIPGGPWTATVNSPACPAPKPPPEPTECGEFEPWPCGQNSPIILDLGNDSYRLTSPANGVRFDLRNQGRTVQTAWTRTGAENAFLALDRNGNGLIDNGSELFGDSTPLRSGQRASNGFEALSELDDNRDGVVDANDAQWSEVLLWTDRDHNGVSTGDELEPIAGSAVTAIETDYKVTGCKDRWGNQFRYQSAFHYGSAPSIRTCYDVVFRVTE